MNEPPIEPDVTQAPATRAAPDDLSATASPLALAPPGYEVLGELGRGGMGVVYKAKQVALNRMVALKMILAGVHAGEEALSRFRTEAEAIARLTHPGIVQVYEVGEYDGLPWFSLEYCDGGNLEKQLAGTPMPPAEAAALIETLTRAMQSAHDKGVVHRDLKPANVLLASGGREPPVRRFGTGGSRPPLANIVPKITDFGLAKKLDEQSKTRTGSVMGTPSYMAPEQASGSKEIGPGADIYSLGAILYECLTGRPPFRAATAMDTILQVIADEPVPPSRLVAKLPRDLETITLKCLQKQPQGRYASATALADDLAAYREGRPIAARPVGNVERLWRWAKRNRGPAVAGGVTVLALLVGSVVSTFFGLRATAQAERAEQYAIDADEARDEEARQREEVQREVLKLTLSRAQQLLAGGDPLASLPWFAEATRLDPNAVSHRRRLNRVLHGLPRPLQLWRLGASINDLAISPDGGRLAAADNAGTVRIWDVTTGEAIGPALEHQPAVPILALAFSQDGKLLATAGGVFLLRGEIRVWDALTGKPVAPTIKGSAAFSWVGFSADGKRLYGADYSVPVDLLGMRIEEGKLTYSVWERETGKAPLDHASFPLPDEPTGATMRRYAHAGTGRVLLVEGNHARVVQLGETGKKRLLGEPWKHNTSIWGGRISPDGRYAITYARDNTIHLRDLDRGREVDFTTGYNWRVLDAAFLSEDDLALAFYDGATQRYDLNTRRPVPSTLERPGVRGWRVMFSDDAGFLTGLTPDGKARVWQVPGAQAVSPWLPHASAISTGLSVKGGRWLATGTTDGTVRLWDLARTEQPTWTANEAPARPTEVSFDDAGRATLVGRGLCWTLDPAVTNQVKYYKVEGLDGRATALAPGGNLVAVGTTRGQVHLVDQTTGKERPERLKMGANAVFEVQFSPDGQWLAVRAAVGEEMPKRQIGEVRAFDVRTGKELARVGSTGAAMLVQGVASCLAVSPDSRYLATGLTRLSPLGGLALQGEVRVVDARTGKTIRELKLTTPGMAPAHVAFSSDGRRLAIASILVPTSMGEITLWDYLEGKQVLPPIRLAGEIGEVAFDPNGKRLAIVAGNEVQVWDVDRGVPLFRLPHADPVSFIRYTGGGKVLVVLSQREVSTWDAATGEGLGPPLTHPLNVFMAGVSPDGRWLVSVDVSRKLYVWDLGGGGKAEESRLARLLSGQVVAGATTLTRHPDELAADWRALRASDAGQLASTAAMQGSWHWERMLALVNAGAWRAAIRQFENLQPEKGNEQFFHYMAGTCLLAVGDREGLRQRCLDMLRRAEKTKIPRDIELAVKLALLSPGTLEDIGPVTELSRNQKKIEKKDPLWPWFVLTEGLAHYRAGRFDEAGVRLEVVRQMRQSVPGVGVMADLVLALTRARQGKGEEARRLLRDADRIMGASRFSWIDRIHQKVVREEARGVVEGK